MPRTHTRTRTHMLKRAGTGFKPSSVSQTETPACSSVSWDFSFIHDPTSGKGVCLPNNCLFPRVAEAPMQTAGCLLSRAVSWNESKKKGEARSSWNIYVVEDDLKTLENPRTWPTFRPRFRKEKQEDEPGRRDSVISASCLESRLQRSFMSVSPLKAKRPSPLPACPPLGWSLNIENSVSCLIPGEQSRICSNSPPRSLQLYEIQNSASKVPGTIISFCERNNWKQTTKSRSSPSLPFFYKYVYGKTFALYVRVNLKSVF